MKARILEEIEYGYAKILHWKKIIENKEINLDNVVKSKVTIKCLNLPNICKNIDFIKALGNLSYEDPLF